MVGINVRGRLVRGLCNLYRMELLYSDRYFNSNSDRNLIEYSYGKVVLYEDDSSNRCIGIVKLIIDLCKFNLESIGNPYSVIPENYKINGRLGDLVGIVEDSYSDQDYYLCMLEYLTSYCIVKGVDLE